MIISIVNQKGGTGKTTTAVNLGSALAKKGNKIMLIDMDPQGNLSYSLGIKNMYVTIADVLLNQVGIKDTLIELEGMDIVPSNTKLSEVVLTTVNDKEYILRNALDLVDDYDYIIIDCPPTLSLLTLNALSATNKVIVPLQMDVLSLEGLEQILGTVQKVKEDHNPDLEVLGVLPVMVDKRKKLSSEIHDYIKENFDVNVFENVIRTNVKAAEAPSFGSSVINYAPSSNSAMDYLAFADEFIMANNKSMNPFITKSDGIRQEYERA